MAGEDVNSFCRQHLGDEVEELLFRTTSVGTVTGVRLADGRRVVVKAHLPRQRRDFLEAAQAVQSHLHGLGFPCPEPLVGPRPLDDGLAVAEELVDRGEYRDAHEPAIRGAMAELLVRQLELAAGHPHAPALARGWSLFAGPGPWPVEPHSPIFDFEATAAGAEWIDAIAETARSRLRPERRRVVGHMDWSAKHFRFAGDRPSVVYDWDSVALVPETQVVGVAAATFTAHFELGVAPAPSPEETRAFVDDYAAARRKPLDRREREQIAAVATYTIAYTARCGHAIRWPARPGSFQAALREHGEEYLAV